MIIFEYCRFGNLQNYLMKNRNNFINKVDEFGDMRRDMAAAEKTDNGIQQEIVTSKVTSSVSCLQDSDGYLVPNTESLQSISTNDFISWSFQIARGMDYLSSKKVLQLCFRIH